MKRDEELVDMVVTRILIEARVAAVSDFVEDQNSANSTKNTEITKRERDGEREHHQWSTVQVTSVKKVHGKRKLQNRSLKLLHTLADRKWSSC